jgi:lantibiotic modifying enzyme
VRKRLKLSNCGIGSTIQLKLDEIAEYLVSMKRDEMTTSSLFTGNAGISLFLFYYAEYTQNEYYTKKAMEFLHLSVNNIDISLNSAFCGGANGISWTIWHLVTDKLIALEYIIIVVWVGVMEI